MLRRDSPHWYSGQQSSVLFLCTMSASPSWHSGMGSGQSPQAAERGESPMSHRSRGLSQGKPRQLRVAEAQVTAVHHSPHDPSQNLEGLLGFTQPYPTPALVSWCSTICFSLVLCVFLDGDFCLSPCALLAPLPMNSPGPAFQLPREASVR